MCRTGVDGNLGDAFDTTDRTPGRRAHRGGLPCIPPLRPPDRRRRGRPRPPPSRSPTCAAATAPSRPSVASRSRSAPVRSSPCSGVNGAGKTSALEVLEGLAPRTAGTVRILGHDPCAERCRRSARHLGVLLQHSGLPGRPHRAGDGADLGRTLTDPRPVAEALDQVDLADRADVRVRSLSGGERRRLDLALALLGRPRVVVLDEPTTGLDPESRRTVWGLIRDLVDGGAAVVLTTHHLEEAEELADRIAVMRAGQIVADRHAGGDRRHAAGHHPLHPGRRRTRRCRRCPGCGSPPGSRTSSCTPARSSPRSPRCSAGRPSTESCSTGCRPAPPRSNRPSSPSPTAPSPTAA